MTEKPFSQSCENNKLPILQLLEKKLGNSRHILEIGSGTGQHAVHFAGHLPWLEWQTSDRKENHQGIRLWMEAYPASNLLAPIELDVGDKSHWPKQKFDGVFTANTAHIMGWSEVGLMFAGVSQILLDKGLFIQYGPFNRSGKFSSESNKDFEKWLKQQGIHMGIRDLDDLEILAKENNLHLLEELSMPANNLILIWEKISSE